MIIDANGKRPFEIRDSTGKEFKEIYDNQDRLLFKNWNEIQGSPPITFRGYGKNLTECRIYGNTVQNGTLSPQAPVDVVGCGVRTGNTMPSPTASTETKNGITCTCYGNGKITIRGTASVFTQFVFSVPEFTIPVSVGQGGGGTFSMFNSFASSSIVIIFYDGNTKIDNWSFSQINRTNMAYAVMGGKRVTMMQLNVSGGISVDGQFSLMFTDDGQSPDKYEPHGYKIPLTINGTEYPIYLGEVETTRRIKKLVLTGEEGWTITSNGVLRIVLSGQLRPSTPLCTHYLGSNSNAWSNVPDKSVTVSIRGYLAILDTTYTAAADFKSYLAAQYAAGTPVTVWYILAEPETGIVNEPIQKIGDYSDELSIADIPTINGINTISADMTVKPSEIYLKGKIKSLATHMLVDSSGNILLTSNNYQLVTKEE